MDTKTPVLPELTVVAPDQPPIIPKTTTDVSTLANAISLPAGFKIREVPPAAVRTSAGSSPPSLGPLAAFVGNWVGNGFNTIFRPDKPVTPTRSCRRSSRASCRWC